MRSRLTNEKNREILEVVSCRIFDSCHKNCLHLRVM